MKSLKLYSKRVLAYSLSGAMALAGPLHAAETDIADGPLAQPATSVKPNMLLILDDSGSMGRQFTPDYVTSNYNAGEAFNCFDSLDTDGAIGATPRDCFAGDPPGMSPDFNTQYYNPEIRYFPAVTYNGGSKGDMDATATTNWTAVPTDNVSTSGSNIARKGLHEPVNNVPSSNFADDDGTLQWARGIPSTPLDTMNLVTGFPDRVWCSSKAAAATDTSLCKTNSSYTYPEFTYGYGTDTSGNRKYIFGAPYYYRITPTEYCTNEHMTTCIAATAPTTVAGQAYDVPAPVRFCDSSALTTCQAKRNSTFKYPKFIGNINPSSAASPGARAIGTIAITAGDTGAPTVQQIRIGRPDGTSVDLLSAAQSTANTSTLANRQSAADQLVTAINNNTSTGLGHGYSAARTPSTSSNVVISAPAVGVVHNGSTITVTAPVSGSPTPAKFTITIGGAGSSNDAITSFKVGPSTGPTTSLISGTITCGSSCSNTKMGNLLRTAINALTGTHGYSASGSGSTVTVTAPSGTGSERNDWVLVWADQGLNNLSGTFAGGVTPGDLSHTTTNFAGGANAVAAATASRQNVGTFVRTNIVSGQTYTKYAARTDCQGTTTCTYEEEMTNFANWFAYYRTRIQMAKTSIGRAFLTLGDDFRVGFKTINFSSSHYLAVDNFTTAAGGQKDTWFNRLYGSMTSTTGSTPLRGALARAGRYYGNQNPNSMGSSPIQISCQPSFAILTSDGYWNDSSGYVKLNGSTSVGNQDSANDSEVSEILPYATKDSGSWDGNKATNTLADIAMYYYTTDLRTDLDDHVPASGDDTAPHQHMTTFTVGMGLAGTLNYDPNYKSQLTGDFRDIRTGTKLWPTPVANEESTLDDLWHAAVNGRGKFFSAQDPVALANGIAETLNSVQQRIGAGAAAATSNLQPVAGDNFAFTAQYQTVEWSGDLKARTIDLNSGTVATRQLWSAQAQLDLRTHPTRRILTLDATDTDSSLTVTVGGVSRTQNANRLRSFCWKDAPIATYPKCDDGGLLTQAEMDEHFDPLGGPNSELYQSVPWATDGSLRHLQATKESLVDFLRGDSSNESSGGTLTTDLYRNRAHLLGDIVNAQPAYIKTPPFSYTDNNYSSYKSTNTTRKGMVYAAANDGMLHAFRTDPDNNPYFQTDGIDSAAPGDDEFSGTLDTNAESGEGSEAWAYVPSLVFPTLKRLAESTYGTNHRFSVDGSPLAADVCFGHTTTSPCSSVANWRTVLVAGLNKGGRGYYALDVTDPENPKALWELKGGGTTSCIANDSDVDGTQTEDCNIGYSYGNPIVAKRPSDGKWVAFLTSGHNNVSPGDGVGHLYVVDVQTGKILQRLSTTAGDTTTPSGLARINGWVDESTVNNTVRTIYGGDLMGNLWRFQMELVSNDSTISTDDVPANSVTLLATLTDPTGVAQPITTRPELGLVSAQRVVYVATGKFLGVTDKTDTQRQSIYAIRDPLDSSGTASPVHDMTRSGSPSTIAGFVRQDFVSSSTTRAVASPQTVSFSTGNGWFVDLPDGGGASPSERVNVDPILQLGTLVVPSNVPSADTCVAGGYGWVNFLDYRSGSYVQGAADGMVSQKISASLVVGINVVQLPGGTVKTIVTTADNQQMTQNTPVAPSALTGKRVTWRELFYQ